MVLLQLDKELAWYLDVHIGVRLSALVGFEGLIQVVPLLFTFVNICLYGIYLESETLVELVLTTDEFGCLIELPFKARHSLFNLSDMRVGLTHLFPLLLDTVVNYLALPFENVVEIRTFFQETSYLSIFS